MCPYLMPDGSEVVEQKSTLEFALMRQSAFVVHQLFKFSVY